MRGQELTHRLLAFTRNQTLEPTLVNHNAVVVGMAPVLRQAFDESIEVDTHNESGLWTVRADKSQIKSAIFNLAINARDEMPQCRKLARRNVNVDRKSCPKTLQLAPGEYVALVAAGSGAGMAPDVVARAFDPFFTTKGAAGGSGLGLSMVHGFVRQSGGYIEVGSKIGHGSTVMLYFPRAMGEPKASAASQLGKTRGDG